MKHRTLDEMIAYFNRQVSEMDIKREYKIQLLGMITAIGHEASAQPKIIRCRNCKHFEQDIMNPNVGGCCHDGWVDRQYSIGFEVNADGFCSRAELKEGQE